MPITIEIQKPSNSSKFKGGDFVEGVVVVTNNSGKSKLLSQALFITFIGKANSQWKEMRKHESHVRQYMTTVYDEEIYFNESIILRSPEASIHNREILPGKTEYPFNFHLPMALPESYESEQGSVTYYAEVLYSRSWKPDKTIKAEFLVAGQLDLNCTPDCCQPGQFTMEKKFWFGFGKVLTKLYLPRRGFIPGESVNFSLEVTNNSRWYLKKIRVYFVKVTTYFAKTSTFNEGARLFKIKCKSVYPKQSVNIEGSILVPEVPPTELGGCRLIHPNYGIMIKVIAATMGNMVKTAVLEGRVPIMIGTVPPSSQSLTVIRPTLAIVSSASCYATPPSPPRRRQSIPGTSRSFVNLCEADKVSGPNSEKDIASAISSDEQPPSYQEATSQTPTPIPARYQFFKAES